MNEIFGRYIGSVFCSFLRICFTGKACYIITSENALNTCKVRRNPSGQWVMDMISEDFFCKNADKLIEEIIFHEASLTSSYQVKEAV